MKTPGKYRLLYMPTVFSLMLLLLGACKKFVTLDDPKGQLTPGAVFSEEGSATAAVLALYADYIDYTFPVMCETGGLAADELFTTNTSLTPYLNNELTPSHAIPGDTWTQIFAHIRSCNLAIDGLTRSTTISSKAKDQLLGEAMFMRAFGFFNLLNFYGDVPLTLSADVIANASLPRAPAEEVWTQIFSDLTTAKTLLQTDYPSPERARANKSVVSALLARAYLYHKDWEKAEAEASALINEGAYTLENPANAFIPGSAETILQVFIQQGLNPIVFDYLPPAPGSAPSVYLRENFDEAFEEGDIRKDNWIGSTGDVFYVQKYKNQDFSGTEYCVLFRLAEIYLIRAEARVHMAMITGSNSAEEDINAVRNRSGLGPVSLTGEQAALMAVEQERKVELFGEYPHRWFDLKRTSGFSDPSKTRADEILPGVKGATWQSTDKLFPIEADQIKLNPNLVQNEGYQN